MVVDSGLMLYQMMSEGKKNEIKTSLSKGNIISADAMHCQKEPLLPFLGTDLEGIVDINFNGKKDGFAFLILTPKNLVHIQDMAKKQRPPSAF